MDGALAENISQKNAERIFPKQTQYKMAADESTIQEGKKENPEH